MMEDAASGSFDVVCVWKLDRLSRKTRDCLNILADLNEMDVKFASATQQVDTTTPLGYAMVTFIAIVAEMERENIIARIKPGMKKAVENGWFVGGVAPYGYFAEKADSAMAGSSSVGSKLKVREEEAKVVRRMFEMSLAGHGTHTIAKKLNEEGVLTNRKTPWTNARIHKMLTNPVYTGQIIWGRKNVSKNCLNHKSEWVIRDDQHEAIVDSETFQKAQRNFRQRNLNHVTRNLSSQYLLTDILFCHKCGGKMSGIHRSVNSHSKEKRRFYRCTHKAFGKGQCTANSLDAELAEKAIIGYIRELAHEPAITTAIQQELEKMYAPSVAPKLAKELEGLRAELAQVQKKRSKLMSSFLDDDVEDPVAKSLYEQLAGNERQIQQQIKRAESTLYAAGTRQSQVRDALLMLESFDMVWDELENPERKQALKAVIASIEANDGHLVSIRPTDEFSPFLREMSEPIRCLSWQRNVKNLNSEVLALRGLKSIREFADELGVSSKHLSEVERGIIPMGDYLRQRIEVWKMKSLSIQR